MTTFLISGFQSMFAYFMMGRFGLADLPSLMPAPNTSLALTGNAAVAGMAFDLNIFFPYVVSGIVSTLGAISMSRTMDKLKKEKPGSLAQQKPAS